MGYLLGKIYISFLFICFFFHVFFYFIYILEGYVYKAELLYLFEFQFFHRFLDKLKGDKPLDYKYILDDEQILRLSELLDNYYLIIEKPIKFFFDFYMLHVELILHVIRVVVVFVLLIKHKKKSRK